jgi:hypothetical protein
MQKAFEKQARSEVPAAIARLLDIREADITVRESRTDRGSAFELRAGKHIFLVEARSSSDRTALNPAAVGVDKERQAMGRDAIPLLVVPYMGETGSRFCGERGLAWMDLSGNAHITAPNLLIHIEGKANLFKHAGRPSNLFAPKSSRIVRRLLMESDRGFTQRVLSQVTGLDEGYVSRIVRRLMEGGLVVKDTEGFLKPEDPGQLLDAWYDAYDFKKHHLIKGYIAARSGEELLHRIGEQLEKLAMDYAATGLGAAWAYTHFAGFRIVTVYLSETPGNALSRDLGFRIDERGANTWLVVPADEGVFHGAEKRDGISCVHPVQAYLDLKGHPERSSEAASRLRQDYLQWRQSA